MMRQKRKSPNIKSRKKSPNIKSRKKSHMISSLPYDIKEKLYNTGMNLKKNDNLITEKKTLIKSSKRLGNSKQNDNLITEEDLVYLNPEELKHYTKKFQEYQNDN